MLSGPRPAGGAEGGAEEEEDDFEGALTDEQPREVGRNPPPDPRRPMPRGGVRGGEASRRERRRRRGAGEGGRERRGDATRKGDRGCGRGKLKICLAGWFLQTRQHYPICSSYRRNKYYFEDLCDKYLNMGTVL